MKFAKNLLSREKPDGEQNGINMVDLMMWLVIAALLLAAAIQGIGYYQQNAYVYQMKSAVDVATSRVTALASNDGNFTIDQVDTVVAEENAAHPGGVVLSASAIDVTAAGAPEANPYGFELSSVVTSTTVGPGQTYYIRASHPSVTGYDVIHTFGDTASKKSGTYLVNKGTTTTAGPGGAPAPAASASSTTTSTASASTTATATSTASPSATTTATPSPSPSPTATRPADVNATGVTIVSNGGYPSLWTDKTVNSSASNAVASYGFSLSQVSSATTAANYTVVFSGGGNIGASTYTQSAQTGNGYLWQADVRPVAGGFTPGTGYITATVTEKATGNVSKKTWVLTANPATGPVQGSFYASQWTDKSAPNMVSGANATFGFQITGAAASDYTVAFTGGSNVGAVIGTIGTNGPGYGAEMGGTNWYTTVSAPSGGFLMNQGAGVITATVTHKLTGQTWTKTYNLNITADPGPVQGNYYASYWNNKTATVASTGSNVFGFAIKSAVSSDFTVTFTSTGNVNENISATQFSSADGADWYAIVSAKTGGYTAGTSTITATATSKSTGQVFTKTYTLTVQ